MSIIVFDPDGFKKHSYIAEVEVLLGGIGRLCFPDGTFQFAENETYPDIVYSPRLTEDELEIFCEENLNHYIAYYEMHREKIDAYKEAPPIAKFWLI